MNSRALLCVSKRMVSLFLVLSFLIEISGSFIIGALLFFTPVNVAEAAAKIVEASPNTTAAGHTVLGASVVFVSELVGYKFHRSALAPNVGMCVYRKTTDGGLTWGSQVAVDTQIDCLTITVWYDGWTPGDTGSFIHIATIDDGNDELFYNRLDTTTDSLLSVTSVSAAPGALGVYVVGTNIPSITKATNGRIYMVTDDAEGTNIRSCLTSCNVSGNWSAVGVAPQGNADSWSMLMPLAAGNIMLINRSTGNLLRSSVWNGTSWTSFTNIDSLAVRNTTYDVGMAATVDEATGDIYLAYIEDNDNFTVADHDLRTGVYNGTWSTSTASVLTNVSGRGLLQVAIAREETSGDTYVSYTIRDQIATTSSTNVYYVTSSDDMASWGAEQGPVNTVPGDLYGLNMNILSTSTLFATWFDNNVVLDVFGDRIYTEPTDTLVVLEPSPNTTASGHTLAGAGTVFINDLVGYKFHRYGAAPNNGMCVYRKTTDGGLTWSVQRAVDTKTDCSGISVWYDKWTPGDTGDYIHIATFDLAADEIYYNRLDTTNDSLLLTTGVSTMLGLVTAYAVGTNYVSITKSTSGRIFVNIDDANGTHIRSCLTTCNVGGNWSAVGTAPQGNADTWSLLKPLSGGNIMLINVSTTNVLRSSIWNGTLWSSFTDIDSAAVRNTTYDVALSATLDPDTGDIYLAYITDNDSFTVADHDLKTAIYSGGGWTAKTSIFTNVSGRGLLQTAIALDQNTGDIYVGYTARSTIGTASTANVYYATSSDAMTTWGSQQGPLNRVAGDFYGLDLNMMSYERLYASWFNAVTTDLDIAGNTLRNIGPEAELSAIGNQKSQVRVSTNDYYVGGAFLLEAASALTVNSIVVSEAGTIHAQDDIKNVKLYYDLDTSAPYDCSSESFTGSETQFGSTVAGGFSGADGVASFNTSPVSISTSQSMCIYVVFDIQPTANDGDTIEISVANPTTDVLISGGYEVYPTSEIAISSSTLVVDPNLTQTGYHWRLDDDSETGATSATAGLENTPLTALQIGTPRRLRLSISNEGSTTSLPTTYRLEYGSAAPTCEDTASWTVVGDPGALWNLSASTHFLDGANTTNIIVADGGVTDAGTTYYAANAALRDTTNTTATTALAVNEYFDLEYSIVASTSVAEGQTYCFRVNAVDSVISNYLNYPSVTISADVLVQGFGDQASTTVVLDTDVYSGGGFSIAENSSSRNITNITLSELGSVEGESGIENLRTYYEFDASAPYNCNSESYAGTENQYGATSLNGFSGVGETVMFSDTVTISTTSTLCLYVVYDVSAAAVNGQVIDIAITSPATDIIASGGASIGPSEQINITGSTTIQGAILTQSHFHWRNDNGSEISASSTTGGSEDVPVGDFAQNSPLRIRFGVTNTGLATSVPTRFRLEYAPKITTCDVATVWTDVDDSLDGWDMSNSSFLTNGETTTNIAVSSGGVSNGVGSFVGTNGGVRDTESLSATTTIPVNDYLDLEYSITSTDFTSFDTTYCFRVSANGTDFGLYSEYAEITTAPKRDFKIQRGSTQVSGTSAVVTAGVGYTAPASTTLAFVRITNSHNTGAGNTAATAGQNADDVTAYISNPGNIGTSFTISRPAAATSNTRVDWEIIEFIGNEGTDNEMIVRGVGTIAYNTTALIATGTALTNVSDNSNVVVFITGASNQNAVRNFYASQVTASWDTTTQSPVFRRGANGASAADVSYAVVEFVGTNWNVQRVEHAYVASGVTETESIVAVNSLARTFLHVQKRMGATTNVVNHGHEVWLSSIGAVSFQLESGATVAVEQTSVAWVIENTQTGGGAMAVQRSSGSTNGGTGPLSLSIVLTTPLEATNNSSISANTRGAGANTTYPRSIAGFTITSTSTYQIWRSNTGSAMAYRVELIEWPVADLSIRQNYYRFYVDNNSLTPTDPWPLGVTDLGENTSITVADEPLGAAERLRVRMTLRSTNATMPAGLQNFKLQYALRSTTCSAVSGGSWLDVGAAASGAVWRGFSATGTTDGTSLSANPPVGGDLLISIANRSGVLVHESPSAVNPYPVGDGDNIEYDWYLEQNGAIPQSTYCFRAVKSDGTPLDGYSNYPQIRTAGFTPVSRNWRWYSDINNETPTSSLAIENSSPIEIANTNTLALRVSVEEMRNAQGENIKFKLQFSDDISFVNPVDVSATTTCGDRSLWCYVEGSTNDNQLLLNQLLTDGDGCTSGIGTGCGTHNSNPSSSSTHTHFAGVTQEYSFTIVNVGARVNAVYYFRLFDVTNGAAVPFGVGEAYPSLLTEGPTMQFSLSGLPAGTTTAGVVTDITTAADSIGFGSLVFGDEYIGAHRASINTNATEGYQVLKFARQQLLASTGVTLPSVTGTNVAPQSWLSGCNASSTGCIGYHTTDATLRDGSTRFAPIDTYAGLETAPVEVMYSSIPAVDTHDIVYRIRVNELQPAGDYQTEIVYLAIPSY